MKRKYAALLLGMTLALSSTAAYAAQTESLLEDSILEEISEEANTDDSTENTAEEDAIYGKVTEISETGITIELGTIADLSEYSIEDFSESADSDDSESSSDENADALSEDDGTDDTAYEASEELPETDSSENDPEAVPVDNEHFVALSFNGVSQVISLTDDTVALQVLSEETEEVNEVIGEADEVTDIEVIDEASDSTADEEYHIELSDEENDDEYQLELSDTESIDESDSELSDEDIDDETDISALIVLPRFEDSETAEISIDDLSVGSYVKVSLDEDGNAAVITVLLASDETI